MKAVGESHADVGDKANDAIRINGSELRARAVGEGGNLGFTQLGRIEYAADGGRINTDFIDNVAGVDTSDHEVNIKILLDKVVADGDLTEKQRNDMIASMTDEVGGLVLKSNYRQNIGLANATAQAPALMHVHQDWVRRLEKQRPAGPRAGVPAERRGVQAPQGRGAWADLAGAVGADRLHQDRARGRAAEDVAAGRRRSCEAKLVSYFPKAIQDRFAEPMKSHQLRREIITTQVVNEFVNSSGITAYHRLSLETGGSVEDVVRANLAASRIFAQPELLARNAELDNVVDAAHPDARCGWRRGRWSSGPPAGWSATGGPRSTSPDLIEFFAPGIAKLTAALPDVLRGRELALFEQRRESLVDEGRAGRLRHPDRGPATGVRRARASSRPPIATTSTSSRSPRSTSRWVSGCSWVSFLERIIGLPRTDRWQTMARAALRDDLHAVHAQLTAQVLATTDAAAEPEPRVITWQDQNATALSRAATMLEEIVETEGPELAHLSVGLRLVRTLLTPRPTRPDGECSTSAPPSQPVLVRG